MLDVSIAIAAAITAYAQIHITKIKLLILSMRGYLYYSDTDSIVIDKTYFNPNWLGKELGKFKEEYNQGIKEAYFISNKTYCLVLNNNDIIIKTKGIKNNSLNLNDFKEAFKIMEAKGHLTEEGLNKIRVIKAGMNTGRI